MIRDLKIDVSNNLSMYVMLYGGIFIYFFFLSVQENAAALFYCECPENILWTKNLHLTLHWHEGEYIITEFSFYCDLFL